MTKQQEIDKIVAKVIAKHEELHKKHRARIKRMQKAGDLSQLDTPLWMEDWQQPVLMYKSDAQLTLEDVVMIVVKELEGGRR